MKRWIKFFIMIMVIVFVLGIIVVNTIGYLNGNELFTLVSFIEVGYIMLVAFVIVIFTIVIDPIMRWWMK